MTRVRTLAYWSVPSLICLLLYSYGFRAWFRTDDFTWLGQGLDVGSFRLGLVTLAGQPLRQGH